MNQEELTKYEREQLIKTISENNKKINKLKNYIKQIELSFEHRIYYKHLADENTQLLNWLNKILSNWFVKLIFPKLYKEITIFINTKTAQAFKNSSLENFYTGEIEPPITPCDFDVNSSYKTF